MPSRSKNHQEASVKNNLDLEIKLKILKNIYYHYIEDYLVAVNIIFYIYMSNLPW